MLRCTLGLENLAEGRVRRIIARPNKNDFGSTEVLETKNGFIVPAFLHIEKNVLVTIHFRF